MIHAQNTKAVLMIKPVSVATNATQTGIVDCRGFRHARIYVALDSAADATNNPAVLDLLESDDTVVTNAVTVSVADTGWTVPAASTDTPQLVAFDVNLKKRKRYLRLRSTSAGAAQLQSAIAVLSRAEAAPDTTTEMGLVAEVKV